MGGGRSRRHVDGNRLAVEHKGGAVRGNLSTTLAIRRMMTRRCTHNDVESMIVDTGNSGRHPEIDEGAYRVSSQQCLYSFSSLNPCFSAFSIWIFPAPLCCIASFYYRSPAVVRPLPLLTSDH